MGKEIRNVHRAKILDDLLELCLCSTIQVPL